MKIKIKDITICVLLGMMFVLAIVLTDNIEKCVNFYENEVNLSALSDVRNSRNYGTSHIKYECHEKHDAYDRTDFSIYQESIEK